MRTFGGGGRCHQVENVANHLRLRNAALLPPPHAEEGWGGGKMCEPSKARLTFFLMAAFLAVISAKAGIQLQTYLLPPIGVSMAESIAAL